MTDRLSPDTPISDTDGQTVGDFWSWAYSDILSNRNRGIFAELLVGAALAALDQPRMESLHSRMCAHLSARMFTPRPPLDGTLVVDFRVRQAHKPPKSRQKSLLYTRKQLNMPIINAPSPFGQPSAPAWRKTLHD